MSPEALLLLVQMQACAPRDMMLASLSEKYHEVITQRGLGASGAMIELTESPEGSWSIIVTQPRAGAKISCMMMSGNAWGKANGPEPKGNPT
jgi:hypothetical protein